MALSRPQYILSLSALLFCLDAHAYNTELSVEGVSTNFAFKPPYTLWLDNAGALIHLDYAFTDHIVDGAPLAESQFFNPQSHIYVDTGNLPGLNTSYYDYKSHYNYGPSGMVTGSLNTSNIGGEYFYQSRIFVGGNYRFFNDHGNGNASEYSVNVGGYPVKGLRLMLTLNRLDPGDKNADLSGRYLVNLGSRYALANELSYSIAGADNEVYSDKYAYSGEFYFNPETALHYGFQSINTKNSSASIPGYNLGVEHFFNNSTSAKILYSYEYLKNVAINKYTLRTIDFSMNVKF